ncbi:MAG: heavy metal translocating P-type ATPase [Lachnospirales bacterium]
MVKLVLENLNCANCAGKIEEEVRKLPEVKSVEFNFINKNMNIETDIDDVTMLKTVKKIVDSIEDGVDTRLRNSNIKEENTEKNIVKTALIRLVLGALLFFGGLFISNTHISVVCYILSYVIFGYDVVIRAIKNILKGNLFDENFLMSLATIAAFVIGEYNEAVAVMLFYQIGEFLQDLAVDKSKRSIKNLMSLNIESVNVIENDKIITKEPNEINIGDIIVVKVGEKIPVDGVIVEGNTNLDMQALTGESVPVEKRTGDNVLSGSINKDRIIKIKAEKLYEESTVARILDMVENSAGKKSKTESFISKFAKIYTPIVVIGAVVLALVPIILGYDRDVWIYRALVFLVSSCPCALVVSIPLTFFSGLGAMSKKGVLIKGSNFLQQLAELDAIAMDKTGTVTMGRFKVTDYTDDITLKYAASLEKFSTHPIAQAIAKEYMGEEFEVSDLKEEAGFGITAKTNGDTVSVGSHKLMEKLGIRVSTKSNVFVALNNKLLGYVNVSDKIKEDSPNAIKKLKDLGINNIFMLTGDKKEIAEDVAKNVGINDVYSELLPEDKVNKLEEICKKYKTVAAVGDGINDAPLLARADIGIAMGGIGSDAAIEAADVVVMDDMLSKIPEAVKSSKYTLKVCKENVAFVVTVKAIVLILAVFGIANMWLAVFADVGTALIAVVNSIKIIRK